MFEYSQNEFEESYASIIKSLSLEHVYQKNHCVIFLGGQPGRGKSSFINQDDFFIRYVKINGDDYRKFHPHFEEIVHEYKADMAAITQSFINDCVERLINELSEQGYNLIIEGTLRNPDTTIGTCELLKNKGYTTDLYVMATDALVSWESTINRAKLAESLDEVPRYVPIEKFNYIVNNLESNVKKIEDAGCFDGISVVNRDNELLYSSRNDLHNDAASIVAKELQLGTWKKYYADNYINKLSENENQQVLVSREGNVRRKGR